LPVSDFGFELLDPTITDQQSLKSSWSIIVGFADPSNNWGCM